MGNGAPAADLRREDEACAQERHRNVRKIEIELNPRTYEESARKKFAELSASNSQNRAWADRGRRALSIELEACPFSSWSIPSLELAPRRGRSGFFCDPCRYIKPLCNEWIALSIMRSALDVLGRCATVRAKSTEMLRDRKSWSV